MHEASQECSKETDRWLMAFSHYTWPDREGRSCQREVFIHDKQPFGRSRGKDHLLRLWGNEISILLVLLRSERHPLRHDSHGLHWKKGRKISPRQLVKCHLIVCKVHLQGADCITRRASPAVPSGATLSCPQCYSEKKGGQTAKMEKK